MLCKKGYVVFLVAQTTVKRQTQKQKKINQQIIKKNKKSKEKYNAYHGPLPQKWKDGRYCSSI